MRTIPRHLRMEPYQREKVRQENQSLIQSALDDRELSDLVQDMRYAYTHSKDQEQRENYKVVLCRAIQKYGYYSVYEAYR